MIGFIKKLFGFGPTVNEQITDSVTQAPYKVETPVATTSVAEQATEVAVKSVAKPAPKKTGAPKKSPAPRKTTGNRPRKPKAPK